MVSYVYRFEKVLTIREQEKNETEMAYKESVRSFEEVATKLYDLLKKKEDLIAFQQDRLTVGSSIDEIHHYARFIDSLEKTIADVQQKVIQARAKMNWHEDKLLEKNLEVRKFEKMREKDFKLFQQEQDRIESLFLDEISLLTYNKREIR
ncbi:MULTISPECIES: flagellar export protein FliJ [Lysinibacillus]|jgi:flagellar FliJ protein|uniref:flagellar export protein FliJ n=1 Tax=Lysinibacillus TaxID=400634 RepID=UPI0000F3B499|nr:MULTISPECIES: flagellar export protein FliJ [Lysinibacillus]EAZ83845.1 flagellar biosynthesis chaperone [Bacillus sp. B14905]HAU33578.1 flagellar export protein FliJ [Lysinibacillus sp.]AJK88986.1 flagellar biosynthesis chaperone [Lysinibacillus fusiformis]KAB0441849.1 flagellar export protein FliJ [Lysinibacillus fusiformis]KEK09628.1 flagellar biosynthesis chaperone [Lysinibacillus sphaericus]